ncbi:hypothetical protein LYNGBM3L_66150 [Moorena producens 3L]|uniref:Uncharacterized protein n=1 Tax=Moorena producens 3L TaxID=489825 RepID=F4Y1C8_9CYAN|nr:hypothetical protein LYNGBM3L_66150 [Moorena producens 3L]
MEVVLANFSGEFGSLSNGFVVFSNKNDLS